MLNGVDICPANGGILRLGDNESDMWLIQSGNQLSYEGVHVDTPSHAEGPSITLTFLGIILVTQCTEIRLP